jgi:16S rRNA (adenine1518-N6/adenine1519-N6)-dimethyltransferase
MDRSQMDVLREYGIRPLKRRGQNFLIDGNLARWIASQVCDLGPRVLELGAGGGALTRPLLDDGARVTAVEVDPRLCDLLRREFGAHERFRLLPVDLAQAELSDFLPPGESLVVAGNLPYGLTSKVLFGLADLRESLTGAVVMIQKEVAERLTAAVGSKDYGILAAVVGHVCQVELLRTVPASVFWPRPEVDSAVVRLRPGSPWPIAEYQHYCRTVKDLFGQRRKKVGTLLRTVFQISRAEVDRVVAEATVDPDQRPEQLPPAQLRSLARALAERERS